MYLLFLCKDLEIIFFPAERDICKIDVAFKEWSIENKIVSSFNLNCTVTFKIELDVSMDMLMFNQLENVHSVV